MAGSMEGIPAIGILVLAFVAGGWATPAGARSVQKCVAADGHVTLTSERCPEGQRLVDSYEATPEQAPPAPAAASRVARPRAAAARAGRSAGGGRSEGSRIRAPDRCQAAQARREQTLRRVGLNRTFDLMRKLDAEVWEACKRG